MTQVPGTVGTPNRTSLGSGGDAPEIVFVLRHYKWLIVVGTVLGFLASVATFFICNHYFPEYTSQAKFAIQLGRPADPLNSNSAVRAEATRDEIERTIKQQILLVLSDRVLDQVLQNDAFQKDPENPTIKSKWLRQHDVLPKVELRKYLDVSGIPGTAVFQIAMRGNDAQELPVLVNAIADTYYGEIRSQESAERGTALLELQNAAKNLEKTVKDQSDGLDEFKRLHDITAITQAYSVKMNTLGNLTVELIKAETDTAAVKNNLGTVKQQVESSTLELPADMEQQYVKNDPSVRNLENTRQQLDQELDVNVKQYGRQHRVCQAIQTRIDTVQRQVDEVREKLRNEGRLRMQENAQNMVKAAESREQDLRARRDQLDSELKDLDKWLVEYRGRSAQLESQQKLLEKYNEAVLVRRLSNSDDVTRVSRFSSAIQPEEKSFPVAKVFLPAGTILGLVLSFGIGYLLEMTNTKIRTPRDISRTMQLPLLGFVPDQMDDSFIDGQLATSIRTSPSSMIAESYRQIRGRLVAQANGQPLRTLLVASAAPGGGATTVASNLANGVALNGQQVLLIDANFYRPGLSQLYSNLPKAGLSDVISTKAKLLDVLVQSPDLPSLFLMSGGTLPAASASELLEGRAFKEMVEELKSRFDLVIFDGAPLNLVSDSLSLAAKLDGVITVVRAGLITRGMVGRIRDQLKQVHARLIGIVLNAAQIRNAGYFRQNYRNFYEYASPTPSPPTPPRPTKVAPLN